MQQGGFRMAWVGSVAPGAMRAAPLVWDGFEQRLPRHMEAALAGKAQDPGPVGQAILYKKMVVVNDIEATPQRLRKTRSAGPRLSLA